MDKILTDLKITITAGVVLALALGAWFYSHGSAPQAIWLGGFQWLHVFFGITWIGLLYYFNFVQIPTMPAIPAELKPGVSKYIAPKALFYFRWGAAFTVLTGAAIAGQNHFLVEALTFQQQGPVKLIGIGMYLALIMAANVWFVIWPNQQRAFGLVAADDAAKAKSARIAMLASRTNTLLSIPMLLAMTNYR